MKNITLSIIAALAISTSASIATADEVAPPSATKIHHAHHGKKHTKKAHTHKKGTDTTPASK
jgi:hypothetical protein